MSSVNQDSNICINDVVDLTIILPNGNNKNQLIKLVEDAPNIDGKYKEVSIDSPLGEVLLGAEVGKTVDYSVHGKTMTVIINGKDVTEKKHDETTQVKSKKLQR